MIHRGTGTRPAVRGCLLGAAAALTVLCASAPAAAQQTADLYRRAPLLGDDAFAGLVEGRGSLQFGADASAGNNALDLDRLGAVLFLAERDSLRDADALDALSLVPRGVGLTGHGNAGARFRIGVPLASGLTVGVGASGRGYGSFRVDDDAVALLRDGNGSRSEFPLGETRGDGLLTAEVGVHGVWHPLAAPGESGRDVRLALGAGVRHVQPLFFARVRSELENRTRIVVTADSIRARVSVATEHTPSVARRGGGYLTDLMARLAVPGSGVALEVGVRGLGDVTVEGVERRLEEVDLSTTRLDSVVDVVESLSLDVRDTVNATVTPPALVDVTASLWSGIPFQLDGRVVLPAGGDVGDRPPAGEVLTTWRLGAVPVRAGARFGGRAGVGGRFGLGLETGSFFLRGSAVTSGGFGGTARGLAARMDVGVWF